MEHANYPHWPGALPDCEACEEWWGELENPEEMQ